MQALIVGRSSTHDVLIEQTLSGQGLDVSRCAGVEAAWEHYTQQQPDLIVLAHIGPESTALVQRIRTNEDGDVAILLAMVRVDDPVYLKAMLDAEVDDCIVDQADATYVEVRLVLAVHRLHRRIRRHRVEAELALRVRQQATVAELGRRALSNMPLAALMTYAAEITAWALDAEFVKVLKSLPEQDDLLLKASVGWQGDPAASGTTEAWRDTQAAYTLSTGAPVVVEDVNTETRFQWSSPASYGIVSGVSVILNVDNQPYGVLCVHSTQRRVFQQEDVNFLQAVANVLAGAIEQEHVEENLLRERNFVSAVLRTAGALIVVLDTEGRIVRFNRTCEQITGYTFEEVKGRQLWDLLLVPSEVEAVKAVFEELREGTPNKFENHWTTRDGQERLIAWSNSVLHDEADDVTYVIGIGIDITERRQAEGALLESEASLKEAQRIAHVGSWQWEIATNEVHCSEEMCRIFGMDAGYATTTYDVILEHIHPNDRAAVQEYIEATLEEEDALVLEYRIVLADGIVRVLRANGHVERDGEGRPIRLSGTVQDITERVKSRQALEESEARHRTILDTTVDGIITIDKHGIVESFNAAAEKIFGYTPEEVIGRNIAMLMPSPYHEEHDSYLQNYLETGHRKIIGIGREVVGLRKDGSIFPMDLAVSELKLADRRIFTGVLRDISERRSLEQEILRISEQERRRIGQDLHDGLGQMLTGISLITKNLARTLAMQGYPGADEVTEVTELIKDADQHARGLARGLMPVDLEASGLSAALRRLAVNAERLFGIRCSFEEVGAVLIDDNSVATHLYRIAQEAVSNAVKHGRAEHVRISLAAGRQIRLRIQDDGVGFPEVIDEERRGMGVRIMHYRARVIGATMEIANGLDGGTTITCTLRRSNEPILMAKEAHS